MIAITPWRRTLNTWVHPEDDLYTIAPGYLDGAADHIGDELVVSARASDGTVEALEHPDRRLLSVQWHPEWLADDGLPLFRWLIEASRQ